MKPQPKLPKRERDTPTLTAWLVIAITLLLIIVALTSP